MIKKILTVSTLLLTTSAFANINNLSVDSSWEEILNTRNVDVRGDGIRVGGTNTSVFFVEKEGNTLYTKEKTRDGYYKQVRGSRDNDRQEYIQTGESIKSGDVTIKVPVYERKRINSERDEKILIGYKDYTQPTTRLLEVYESKESGMNDNIRKRLLFKKEYIIPERVKM